VVHPHAADCERCPAASDVDRGAKVAATVPHGGCPETKRTHTTPQTRFACRVKAVRTQSSTAGIVSAPTIVDLPVRPAASIQNVSQRREGSPGLDGDGVAPGGGDTTAWTPRAATTDTRLVIANGS